ncbi:peptidoglycan-binding domain-containing protein [Streptomyces sp. H27-D2]|uniref:peptidoglycan-binding domain-containing protein n=1 Tax=Streptomyces sp. H27-D2 TaxID=3046304 RepID=UPI002DB59D3E|nr:peptidoglycan-binding domain-containing protein [Streptomyces sp. H27-D2]MEC4017583.1 peptidoglycan-binding domain-containing protein [Streptomyces sp. H27-D2]
MTNPEVSQVCQFTKSRPTIKRGASGVAVKQAQCYLNHSLKGKGLLEDGEFGPVTDAAVHKFQKCADITIDGIIGAQTWSHLTFWANSSGFAC